MESTKANAPSQALRNHVAIPDRTLDGDEWFCVFGVRHPYRVTPEHRRRMVNLLKRELGLQFEATAYERDCADSAAVDAGFKLWPSLAKPKPNASTLNCAYATNGGEVFRPTHYRRA